MPFLVSRIRDARSPLCRNGFCNNPSCHILPSRVPLRDGGPFKKQQRKLGTNKFRASSFKQWHFWTKKIRSTTKFADTTAQFWINELQDIILCQEDRSPQQCKLELIVCDSSFAGVQLHFQIHVWIYFYLWVLFNTYLLTWQVCCLWILTTRMDKHLQKPQKTSTQVGSKPQSLKLFDPTV